MVIKISGNDADDTKLYSVIASYDSTIPAGSAWTKWLIGLGYGSLNLT